MASSVLVKCPHCGDTWTYENQALVDSTTCLNCYNTYSPQFILTERNNLIMDKFVFESFRRNYF